MASEHETEHDYEAALAEAALIRLQDAIRDEATYPLDAEVARAILREVVEKVRAHLPPRIP
jgi:hypothetical protein